MNNTFLMFYSPKPRSQFKYEFKCIRNWPLPTFRLADKLTATDKLKEYSNQANLPRKLFLSHSEIWWFETFISIATLLPRTTDLPIYFTCYYTDLINIIEHFKHNKPLRERKKKGKKEMKVGQR